MTEQQQQQHSEQKQSIPIPMNIAIDTNLVAADPPYIMAIVQTYQMTEQNHKELVGTAFATQGFGRDVTNYGCDICDVHCTKENPVYTNNTHQGCDICTRCMQKAFPKITQMPGWHPGPVYSLEDIVKAVKF